MKFCPKKTYSYKGINNIETTVDYIEQKDILNFHGKLFYEQWLIFAKKKNLKPCIFNELEGYYYFDYKELCYTTQLFIEQ